MIWGGFLLIFLLTGAIELSMGRSWFGPDGRLGVWEGNIWSNENSQRLLDPYSLTHISHGIVFFALLWLVARRLPLGGRFLIATLIEAAWEIAENSPLIIDRYREATIALGYTGDSIVNSLSDLLMMATGFWVTSRLAALHGFAFLLALELCCVIWFRDNLALNVVMLIYPVNAIKTWQMNGR